MVALTVWLLPGPVGGGAAGLTALRGKGGAAKGIAGLLARLLLVWSRASCRLLLGRLNTQCGRKPGAQASKHTNSSWQQ